MREDKRRKRMVYNGKNFTISRRRKECKKREVGGPLLRGLVEKRAGWCDRAVGELA